MSLNNSTVCTGKVLEDKGDYLLGERISQVLHDVDRNSFLLPKQIHGNDYYYKLCFPSTSLVENDSKLDGVTSLFHQEVSKFSVHSLVSTNSPIKKKSKDCCHYFNQSGYFIDDDILPEKNRGKQLQPEELDVIAALVLKIECINSEKNLLEGIVKDQKKIILQLEEQNRKSRPKAQEELKQSKVDVRRLRENKSISLSCWDNANIPIQPPSNSQSHDIMPWVEKEGFPVDLPKVRNVMDKDQYPSKWKVTHEKDQTIKMFDSILKKCEEKKHLKDFETIDANESINELIRNIEDLKTEVDNAWDNVYKEKEVNVKLSSEKKKLEEELDKVRAEMFRRGPRIPTQMWSLKENLKSEKENMDVSVIPPSPQSKNSFTFLEKPLLQLSGQQSGIEQAIKISKQAHIIKKLKEDLENYKQICARKSKKIVELEFALETKNGTKT